MMTARLAAGSVIEPAGVSRGASRDTARDRRDGKLSSEVRAELRRLRCEAPLRAVDDDEDPVS